MYNMEKDKCRKHHKNPSFSSTLLDEIYRSIDGYDQRKVVSNIPKETKKYSNKSNGGAKPKANNNNNNNKSIEDEEIASFRRACLVEKWMEKKVKDKVLMTRKGPSSLPDLLDNDPFFFSSTSSSESNSGTLSTTSSEADCFYSEKSSRNTTTTTCFAASKSKKSVRRASVSPRRCENPLYNTEQSHEFYLFDDYHSQKTEENEESLIKSKSRALKIYNNLKKVKQPISPGGRLTNFLSSIFNNGNGKKSKNNVNIERNAKSGQAASSTCSSASSFSRSCLSTKTPPNLTPKFQNGVKRTVRFNPVSVIVDEDCRPCGHKCIYDQESDNLQKLKSQGNAAIIEKNRKYEVTKVDSLKNYQQLKKKNDYIVDYTEEEDDFEDEDAASDSSSDLFEIDHLAFFGNNRFCEELPVYETTHLDTNRGIANRFIR